MKKILFAVLVSASFSACHNLPERHDWQAYNEAWKNYQDAPTTYQKAVDGNYSYAVTHDMDSLHLGLHDFALTGGLYRVKVTSGKNGNMATWKYDFEERDLHLAEKKLAPYVNYISQWKDFPNFSQTAGLYHVTYIGDKETETKIK